MHDLESIRKIKDALPDVLVEYQCRILSARVSGRINPFATVTPFWSAKMRKGPKLQFGASYEVAWETVARCYAEGRPINLGCH